MPLDGVDGVDNTLSTLLLFEIAISSGITILVLVATWLLVRSGMRPLERMGATARTIAATGLGSRVSPSTEKTEVGRLGLALNEMLGQIERAFAERDVVEQRLRHFVSDASHELRTPLTSMRGYAELLQRNPDMSREDVLLAVRRIEDETRRMGIARRRSAPACAARPAPAARPRAGRPHVDDQRRRERRARGGSRAHGDRAHRRSR